MITRQMPTKASNVLDHKHAVNKSRCLASNGKGNFYTVACYNNLVHFPFLLLVEYLGLLTIFLDRSPTLLFP